jgi:hypothetical protein
MAKTKPKGKAKRTVRDRVENNGGSTGGKRVGGVTGKGFRPGQSGNPGGRPKALAEVKALAAEHTRDAINALHAIATDDKKDERARVQAAVALLDRAWGKPAQAVEVSGPAGGPVQQEVRAEVTPSEPPIPDEERARKLLEAARRAGLLGAGGNPAADPAAVPVVEAGADAAAGGVPDAGV